jgi:nitroimidazol reductase NimA-like FMN-containing flavoprotein (pyridoxamine 5'-phosphate oxidase superfamily)
MRELATDRAGLEILHLGDCFLLLESVRVGRVGFVAGGEVVILPVNFLVDGQDVVFTTGAGSKLSAVEVGHYVGFEADSYDQAARVGWSVVVNGLAEIVDSDSETARLDALGLKPWAGAAERVWVRIRPSSVSGRRIPAPAASDRPAPAAGLE